MQKKQLVVLNIVGLTSSMLGENTPNILSVADNGFITDIEGVFPAVTSTAQASMLTGTYPNQHGIVANGWYWRDLAEIFFWRQVNQIVQAEKVWEMAKKKSSEFTTAQLFWWYNMYASVEYSLTLRPFYPADGRKIPALYSFPNSLQSEIETSLGKFPMFNFWGPKSDSPSSQWIANSAKHVFDAYAPNLMLVYLPHLDYNLQRLGPNDPATASDIREIDDIAGSLIQHVRSKNADVIIVSEYGIEQAHGHVHINRILREHGFLSVRETLGWELLDCGASRAFAVADHQVAHIYIKNPSDVRPVQNLLKNHPGIDIILDHTAKQDWHIDHERSGELIAIAEPGYWFTYYYWMDNNKAPDFARTVDIHRKPGFDPVELFLNPDMSFTKLKILYNVAKQKLGFRTLFEFIPLKPELVKGTHGRLPMDKSHGPLLIGSNNTFASSNCKKLTDIPSFILKHYH